MAPQPWQLGWLQWWLGFQWWLGIEWRLAFQWWFVRRLGLVRRLLFRLGKLRRQHRLRNAGSQLLRDADVQLSLLLRERSAHSGGVG